MFVVPAYEVLIDRLRTVFGFLSRPQFGTTDFVGEYGSSAIPMMDPSGKVYSANDAVQTPNVGNVECDPLRKVIYARHLFVPHSQVFSPGGCTHGYYGGNADTFDPATHLPTLKWWNLKTNVAASSYTLSSVSRALGWTALEVAFAGTPGSFVMDGCSPLCQGFKAFLSVAQSPSVTAQASYYASCRWRVSGSARAPRWYAASYQIGAGIGFYYNDSVDASGDPVDAAWVLVDTIKMGADVSTVLAPSGTGSDLPMLDVRLIAGQMTVSVGSEDTPYPWPHMAADDSGIHDWYIDAYQVAASNVLSLAWEFHPTKFCVNAGYVSVETNAGFTPESVQLTDARYITHCEPHYAAAATGQVTTYTSDPNTGATNQVGFLPPGSTALAHLYDVNEELIRYYLTFANTATGMYKGNPYADFTAAVSAVSMDIPGVLLPPPPSQLVSLGTDGAIPLPESMQITHTFDLGRLCITRSAALTFNNFYGQWTNGDGTGVVDEKGHFAVEVNLGAEGDGTPSAPWGALQTEFIGVANTQFQNNWGEGGKDKLTLFCEDQWVMLDVPSWNLPWFDGWNVYSVMQYLAGLGTLPPSSLAFAHLVPGNPYDLSPGLPNDQQFFMPIGVAGTPLTRFTGGQKLKDVMLKISQTLGCIMYFDHNSLLHFEKFLLPPAGSSAITFSHRAGDALTGGEGLGEIISGSYSGGLSDQRNSVTVIGVNAFGPIWNPIVKHRIDEQSIYDDSAPNYVGFTNPMVWVDNIFVSREFAQKAVDSLFNYLDIPDRQVSLSCWYQPATTTGPGGVYPGNLIRVITPRSGAEGYTFFVTQTTVSVAKGQITRCDIQARIVPQG